MSRLKIGVRLESLGLPFRKAVEEAEKQGAAGVQFDAAGPLAPEALSQTGRREIRHLLRSHNLEASALGESLYSQFLARLAVLVGADISRRARSDVRHRKFFQTGQKR